MNKLIIGAFLSICICACSILNPVPTPQVHEYQLVVINNADDTPTCKADGEVLQITHVKADAPFDTTTMYYSDSQYELKSYGVHRWAALPGQMLTQAIQQKILKSCRYKSVVSDDFITLANSRLTTQLIEEKQVITGNDAKVVLVIITQLIDNRSNKVIKGKTFEVEVTTSPDATGYVSGVNQATTEYLNQLLAWINPQ